MSTVGPNNTAEIKMQEQNQIVTKTGGITQQRWTSATCRLNHKVNDRNGR